MRHTWMAALAALLAWPVTAETPPIYDVLIGPSTVACETLDDLRALLTERKLGRCALVGVPVVAAVQVVEVLPLEGALLPQVWLVRMQNPSGGVVFSFVSQDPATMWTARVKGVPA